MKTELVIDPPLLNAAGTLGFAPDMHGPVDVMRLGAFVTNPISPNRRSPTQGLRTGLFPGGFLLHTGLPNPGFFQAVKRFHQKWANSPVGIIVHLMLPYGEGGSMRHALDSLNQMALTLESTEGVVGIELGLPLDTDGMLAIAATEAAAGEIPVIVRLPVEQAPRIAHQAAADLLTAGAAALSLGAPRGVSVVGKRVIQGRMYGPAVFPLALSAVYAMQGCGLPVIAGGGVYASWQRDALRNAGAVAVQLDSALWLPGSEALLEL